jgi:alpha-1,6-mannosyltransferase
VGRAYTIGLAASAVALLALTGFGLRFQSRDDLDSFLVVAALQSVCYLAAVWFAWRGGSSRRVVLGIAAVAVLLRAPIAVAPPYLSADIYRYVWDGRIEAAGFNPYRYTPTDPRLTELRDPDIFSQIASKDVPTIYPPIAEAIFLAVTRVSETATAMKAAMVAFEIVTFVLLVRLLALERLPTARVIVYAWHPLPLWEFAGSGHIDAALIAVCVAAVWASRRGRSGLTGLFLAGATLVKLYPAVLLPALYRRWGRRLPAAFAAAMGIGYLPFVTAGSQVLGFLPGYAAQEGFNANGGGFYLLGLLRHLPLLGAMSAGTYVVGAAASLATLGILFVFARDRSVAPFAAAATLATAFVLFVSPHYPWYFAWLILFACLIRSFALLWLTNACLLLYLVSGYVFAPGDSRLAIESMIYGPFLALALVDLWYHHSGAATRSSRPCRSA